MALSSAMTGASDVMVPYGPSLWIGPVARLVLWILPLLLTSVSFALKLASICNFIWLYRHLRKTTLYLVRQYGDYEVFESAVIPA